jgi:fluoroquinolone transport system permease protein
VTREVQLRALAPALLRTVRWHPVAGSAVASALLLWSRWSDLAVPANALWLLRTVAVLLAVGVAFALDDPTRPTLAAVPTPLWWRVALRLLCVGLPAALVWLVAVVTAEWQVDGTVAQWALTLEALTLAAVALALAGGLARWRGSSDPGTVVAPTMLGLGLLVPQLPGRFALSVGPRPDWAAAHIRWSALLGVAVLVLALSLRDPAARHRRGSGRREANIQI